MKSIIDRCVRRLADRDSWRSIKRRLDSHPQKARFALPQLHPAAVLVIGVNDRAVWTVARLAAAEFQRVGGAACIEAMDFHDEARDRQVDDIVECLEQRLHFVLGVSFASSNAYLELLEGLSGHDYEVQSLVILPTRTQQEEPAFQDDLEAIRGAFDTLESRSRITFLAPGKIAMTRRTNRLGKSALPWLLHSCPATPSLAELPTDPLLRLRYEFVAALRRRAELEQGA